MATVTSARLQPWAEEVGRGRLRCASMTVMRRPPASGALDDGGESPVALRWRYVGGFAVDAARARRSPRGPAADARSWGRTWVIGPRLNMMSPRAALAE